MADTAGATQPTQFEHISDDNDSIMPAESALEHVISGIEAAATGSGSDRHSRLLRLLTELRRPIPSTATDPAATNDQQHNPHFRYQVVALQLADVIAGRGAATTSALLVARIRRSLPHLWSAETFPAVFALLFYKALAPSSPDHNSTSSDSPVAMDGRCSSATVVVAQHEGDEASAAVERYNHALLFITGANTLFMEDCKHGVELSGLEFEPVYDAIVTAATCCVVPTAQQPAVIPQPLWLQLLHCVCRHFLLYRPAASLPALLRALQSSASYAAAAEEDEQQGDSGSATPRSWLLDRSPLPAALLAAPSGDEGREAAVAEEAHVHRQRRSLSLFPMEGGTGSAVTATAASAATAAAGDDDDVADRDRRISGSTADEAVGEALGSAMSQLTRAADIPAAATRHVLLAIFVSEVCRHMTQSLALLARVREDRIRHTATNSGTADAHGKQRYDVGGVGVGVGGTEAVLLHYLHSLPAALDAVAAECAPSTPSARRHPLLDAHTAARLQMNLHALSAPGGPLYPSRAVRHAALAALERIFSRGVLIRRLIFILFRALHPFRWPPSLLHWTATQAQRWLPPWLSRPARPLLTGAAALVELQSVYGDIDDGGHTATVPADMGAIAAAEQEMAASVLEDELGAEEGDATLLAAAAVDEEEAMQGEVDDTVYSEAREVRQSRLSDMLQDRNAAGEKAQAAAAMAQPGASVPRQRQRRRLCGSVCSGVAASTAAVAHTALSIAASVPLVSRLQLTASAAVHASLQAVSDKLLRWLA